LNDIELVKDLLGELHPRKPRTEGGLTLVPLFGDRPAKDYFLAHEAFGFGLLKIGEVGGGQVPNVSLDNRSELPVLVLDGEHLEGARQNRITNVTVLVAANSKTVLPVSCVEQGRWHLEGREDFTPSLDHSYARLRRVQAESSVMAARSGRARRADQGEVWMDVALKQQEMGVEDSRAGAMRDAYEARRQDLARLTGAFAQPERGQTGVVAIVGDTVSALDVFDKPETLTSVWPRQIAAYAVDALSGATLAPFDPHKVGAFLAAARGADLQTHPAVGLGTDVTVVAPNIIGGALAWERGVPHVALFPRGRDPEARPASRRARSYFRGDAP
jgi:hypothetical protein